MKQYKYVRPDIMLDDEVAIPNISCVGVAGKLLAEILNNETEALRQRIAELETEIQSIHTSIAIITGPPTYSDEYIQLYGIDDEEKS